MEVLAVVADPVRRRIVEMLAEGERTAGEIAGGFDISGPAISRHLRVLRESGLAVYRSDAQRRIYTLNPKAIEDVQGWASELLKQWRGRFDALGSHLDDKAKEAPGG